MAKVRRFLISSCNDIAFPYKLFIFISSRRNSSFAYLERKERGPLLQLPYYIGNKGIFQTIEESVPRTMLLYYKYATIEMRDSFHVFRKGKLENHE
ncbi:hypothetical protein GUT184_14440 [Streptococcus ruminantium]|nr:hypothetical protein GUT184_14440 [Streptococcus ruminantium]BDD42214.1 hypothetical protein GUT189_05470 [Streptococcus ruminantium]